MKLYYNPVSSYSQKVLTAFHEKGAKFEPAIVNLMDPQGREDYEKIWPLAKIPVLKLEDKDWTIPESSIIIEYIDRHCPGGTKLIPDDADLARQVRMRDRFFDCYVNDPMQKIFFDTRRPAGKNDPFGVEAARKTLNTALDMLDKALAGKTWVMGDDFTMADCAAAPALYYCRLVNPYEGRKNLTAYAGRLFERPSYARVMKEFEPILAKMRGG
jgi:glutathione S-transferase